MVGLARTAYCDTTVDPPNYSASGYTTEPPLRAIS
jgi:hypothetical protein